METIDSKQSIRNEVRKRIMRMTEAERMSQSFSVCKKILATAEWTEARRVLLYEALPDELNLTMLFEEATKSGKDIFCPKASANAPDISPITLSIIDLIIVPGRAFCLTGERLGRGKGYYDRMLAQTVCPTFGAAFDCQIFETLPTESWDKCLDRIFVK